MVYRNFYKNKEERLKLRKRYRIRRHIENSSVNKYVVYVYRSNKHLYLQLLLGGYTVASNNTIKYLEDKVKLRKEVIKDLVQDFYNKVILILSNFTLSSFLYDISYYKYKGCVKIAIDNFRDLVKNYCSTVELKNG